jgi:hypothetical protein
MSAGLVNKTVGDGNGGTMSARFLSDDGTLTGHLSPAPTFYDVNGNPIVFVPNATGNGLTGSRVNAAASNNLTSLKATAGNLYEIDVFNVAAYTVFLKLYNKATAPVVATDTPIMTIPIAAGTGFSRSFPNGKTFSTGIAYAIVKLQADTDATNVVAGDLTGSLDWI